MKPENSPQNERKRVTVLFADISGSTELVEKMDPEDVVSDLLPTVELMVQAVQQFGGTVVKTMGDGIMAIFGAPVALERHAERASYAALEIQRLVEAQHSSGSGDDSTDIRVHLGLTTGEVVVGFLGDEAHATYDAAGFTVHLASRLQAMAPAGAIYISHATFKWLGDRFVCDSLGPTRVRGSEEPVKVYALKGLKHEGEPHPGAPGDREGVPFIGRQQELDELLATTRKLIEGRGSVVSIVGDPGMGKSRLISEFKRAVAEMPVTWLEGASLPYGRTLAYWPFLELLRGFAGIVENDDELEAWRKLENQIVELFGEEAADVLPYVATLLGLRVRGKLDERVRFLDGEGVRRQIFRSMRLLLARLAQQQPAIVLLEDAFWMDRSSTVLLAHLIPLIEDLPLLICLVTRGESLGSETGIRSDAASLYPQRYQEIVLNPLSESDTEALVDHLMQTSNLPLRIRKAVCAASEGNPLFAEELARSLLEGDSMMSQQAGGRPSAAFAGNWQLELPGSIESVIMARVDQLEESAKELLKTASVVGRTFIVRVLAAVTGSEEVTRNGLVVLKHADLILDRRREPDPECMFKHVLVQEATYNSILVKRRRQLHARVGDTIEQLFSDRLDDLAGLVAHHYARAEQWEKAQFYLLKAGDQADRLAADEEALAHFQIASEAYLRAFGQEAEPIWQATLARKVGEAHYRKGDSEEARDKFREALGLLGSRDPRTKFGLVFQIIYQVTVQLIHRLLPITTFDRRLGSATQADEERVRLYIMQWWLNFFESPYRTLLYSLKTLNESEVSGAVDGIVHSCSTLGFICCVLGLTEVAEKYHTRAGLRARDSNNPVVFGHVALGWGWQGTYTGRWPDAVAHFRRSADASRGAGDLRQWGSASWGTILVLCHLGRFSDAWDLAQELFEISDASSDQVNLRWSHVAQGVVLLRLGAFAAAKHHLETAIAAGEAASDWQIYTKAACELARSSLMQEDLTEAAAYLKAAAGTVRKFGLRGHHVCDLKNVQAMLLQARFTRGGRGLKSLALRWQFQWACFRALRGAKTYSGALPEALRLRGQCAWLAGRPKKALKWWELCRKKSEQLGAAYDLALLEIEIGRRLADRERVARGEARLAQSRKGVSIKDHNV